MAVRRDTLQRLVDSPKNKKIGNHRVEIQPNGDRWYYYFQTPIFKHLNPDGYWEFIIVVNCSKTTTQTVSQYRKIFNLTPENRDRIREVDYCGRY